MLDVFLDYMKKLLKSRLFPISVIYIALFCVIIYQLFNLQIVQGPVIAQTESTKNVEEREIKSTRGNIYDRKGVLLATNELTYSVVMDDISVSNEEFNNIIYQLIKIIEKNGDTLDNKFYITQNDKGEFEFTVSNASLTRFINKVYTYMYDKNGELPKEYRTEKYLNPTAQDIYEFLRDGTGNNYTHMFGISDEYSVEDTLKIMSIRYALFCNYPKYLQITVASDVSKATVAAVKESGYELSGVKIQQQTSRVYMDSVYFAHMIGYTGLISAEELDKMEQNEDLDYNSTDVIGKSGLEQEYELYLAGTKGSETVSINKAGKMIDVLDRIDPVAGNDLYLTIDSELQKNAYIMLEREITRILLENIVPNMSYGSKGKSASEITIPIYEVYNALINNNIIDINAFDDKDATSLEQTVYQKYLSAEADIMDQYDQLLSMDNTVTNNNAGDMEDFLDYFYEVLTDNQILLVSQIPSDNAVYLDYNKNNSISLSKFLQYAITNNWVDLSVLGVGDEYNITEELYEKLLNHTKELLMIDSTFNKMIYRNLVFSYNLSGKEICLLLFDQGVLEYNEGEINRLDGNNISAYDFIRGKISSLEITPGMLALEPCSGSVVITDVKTGDVLALVSYPSYDNNMMANKVDPVYFNKLLNDRTKPLINRPLTAATAPGSTFKMITSFAALEEGVTTTSERILDEGEFTKIIPSAKCHTYPNSHGSVSLVDAIKVSCNYFFYEMGWRLSIGSDGKYDTNLGLTKLQKYASLFGLNEKSGIDPNSEAKPNMSTKDAVRSSIGQGNNNYTPAQMARYVTTLANRGICYNLTIVDKIKDKDGNLILENSAAVGHEITDFKESSWDTVLEGMYSVVNAQNGSVVKDFENFGVTIAGKAGTSQINANHPNNALFISFAPYEAPEIAVTAVIPNGYTSHNAARLSKDIYSLYFGLEDASSLTGGNVSGNDGSGSSALE